jgi:ketosteroid isomerase-like protein
MSIDKNVQVVKGFFAAIARGDIQGLLALSAEDIDWLIPGDWAWAGTIRGHAGLSASFKRRPKRWRFHPPTAVNSWRKETGLWSWVSLGEESKRPIGRLRINTSSPSLFEMAR